MAKGNNGRKSNRLDKLLNYSKNSYLERTSRPFCAAVFLLPFIVFYEIGTIFINTDLMQHSQIRVVAFVWLQNFLQYLGFASKFAWVAPPLVVLVILLSQQAVSQKGWKLIPSDLWKMAAESILLALPLLLFNIVLVSSPRQSSQYSSVQPNTLVISAQVNPDEGICSLSAINSYSQNSRPGPLASIITGIGAGIYEELIFRLILISLLMIILFDVSGFSHSNAIIISILASAALFSAYHHIDFFTGRQTEAFGLTVFLFRTLAGVYFASIFAARGFGITAGTHAFYDIIAVAINAISVGH
jgi:hypothetical protein